MSNVEFLYFKTYNNFQILIKFLSAIEMDVVDPILHEKIDIGLPHQPLGISQEDMQKYRRQQRSEGDLERAARHRKCAFFIKNFNFDSNFPNFLFRKNLEKGISPQIAEE